MFGFFVKVMLWGIKPQGENENRARFYLRAVAVQSTKAAAVGLIVARASLEFVPQNVAISIFGCILAIGVLLGLAVCE